ncbi:HAD-IIA family hydrolase [Arthrobacter roseus]|uniref:HAD-IIA family hydrolase n=1 Tax=Arthrobacter roseus TaxID=136274 RepID=UPI0019643BA4|nr:HAD-IIA family hydrolase [Arthrobacter roseus]MBM7848279.1 HAD superfamily hydrolase (TIGR01450 family) [Arthrobacter roseus]
MRSDELISGFDAVLSDLDGVVYVGHEPVPGAVETLKSLSDRGVALAYVTNNASRSPDQVAQHLQDLGVPATALQVFGSAPEGAQLLARKLPPGASVLVIGSQYLKEQAVEVGLTPVDSADDKPVGVLQGFDSTLAWTDLSEAAYAVASGAVWVATNTDMSLPGSRGTAPGNGTLVAAVSSATGKYPEVAGKPEAGLFTTAACTLGSHRPLVVGDRLDTDIRGGNRAGMTTALVMTGVNSWMDALGAPASDRPDLLLHGLCGLYDSYLPVEESNGVYRCGKSRAQSDQRTLYVDGDQQNIEYWRAACASWWASRPLAESLELPELVNNGPDIGQGGRPT